VDGGGDDRPVIDIYGRLSYRADGSVINVDEQIDMGRADVKRRGGVVGMVWRDDAKSAWNPRVVRPAWEKLMSRLESGAADGVWVLEAPRFSRKISEGERLVEAARAGRLVWSAAGEYDLNTAEGRRIFRKEMVDAAAESDKTSERSRRGKRRKASRGRNPFGGPRTFGLPGYLPVPAGWEPGDERHKIDDATLAAEQEIIRECYERLLAGQITVAPLARELNRRGFRTVNGNLWDRRSLADSLVRPLLAGLIMIDGEIVGRLAGFVPVVSEDDWRLMCALLAARRPGRPPGVRHMLSGLMRCPCGSKLYGRPYPASPPYPDGQMKRAYRCREDERKGIDAGCGNSIDARRAEAIVREAVIARLSDPEVAESIATRARTVDDERARLDAELAHWSDQADQLADKTASWGVARVNRNMIPIMAEIERLNTELSELDSPTVIRAMTNDAEARWEEAENAGDHETLRSMIRFAFPALTVRPPTRFGDHSPARFDWEGTGTVVPAPPGPDVVLRRALDCPDGKSVHELCADTGMSYSWVHKRVKKLQNAGDLIVTSPARGGAGRGHGMIPARYALTPAARTPETSAP
jgi:DNA invertase Pin-like site-specific DNA recombinase